VGRLIGLLLATCMGLVPIASVALFSAPAPSGAQIAAMTIVVNTFEDELNSDGDCALREAVQAANTDVPVDACPAGSGGPDVILLATGTYTLTLAGNGEDRNATGDLDVLAGGVTIQRAGAGYTTVDGNELDRVLHVHRNAVLQIEGVTVTNGHAPDGNPESNGDGGGGILNAGTLILEASEVTQSTAGTGGENGESDGGRGGGIFNAGELTLLTSAISGNSAGSGSDSSVSGEGGDGGGVFNAGDLRLEDTTISGNAAGRSGWGWGDSREAGDGGGIYNIGSLGIMSSTVVNNTAGQCWSTDCPGGQGGGIFNASAATVTRSSVISNTASASGYGTYDDPAGPGGGCGGVFNGGALVLTNSIVSGNRAGDGGKGDHRRGGDGGNGGGIHSGGELEVARSSITRNAAGSAGDTGSGWVGIACTGGGIYSTGVLTLTNSTVSTNKAGNGGRFDAISQPGGSGGSCGGVNVEGTAMLVNSTIADNRPGQGGSGSPTGPDGDGGALCADGSVMIENTIIGRSARPSTLDCVGIVHSEGHNLVEVPGQCAFAARGDLVGVDLEIGPLADNGGDTLSHSLLDGSPAIDQGSCRGSSVDQRGKPRPVDISGIANADDGCDIGAYEMQPHQSLPTPTVTATGSPSTSTPTPGMLRDVNVFGVVVARETPVRARILLHPSDGRCPWSDGYRSGADGRFDRTCSDARSGSAIDVWVLAEEHDRWMQSYRVEPGDVGAQPIEVRAVLAPLPTRPGGATPTATPMHVLGKTRWLGQVVKEGGVPVPWASVSVEGALAMCISPAR